LKKNINLTHKVTDFEKRYQLVQTSPIKNFEAFFKKEFAFFQKVAIFYRFKNFTLKGLEISQK